MYKGEDDDMPKRTKKDIGKAKSRFESGVAGAGPKWEKNAKAGSSDYSSGFSDVLSDQNACSDQVLNEGLTGFPALVSYSTCIADKRGPK